MVYVPSVVPLFGDFEQVARWLRTECEAISRAQSETTALELRPVFVVPERPREGMIVYFKTPTTGPGAGVHPIGGTDGSYEFRGVGGLSGWHRLGP